MLRIASTRWSACAVSTPWHVTSTRNPSCPDALTPSAATTPPADSTTWVSRLASLPRAGASSRTVIEYETLGTLGIAMIVPRAESSGGRCRVHGSSRVSDQIAHCLQRQRGRVDHQVIVPRFVRVGAIEMLHVGGAGPVVLLHPLAGRREVPAVQAGRLGDPRIHRTVEPDV